VTAALEARGLTAGYAGIPAIREVDLAVAPGEVVALLGANGAGKTTTILTLCGEIDPLAGEVRWRGKSSGGSLTSRARDGLALITEEKSVFMNLSVAENLRLGRGDADLALELFPELREHMRRRVGLLSGGQQQTLTVPRALAARPRALLADELSLGLAPQVVRRLLTAIRDAADQQGLGVLLVEQHVRNALEFADRLYVLRRGRVVLTGTAEELSRRTDEIEASYLAGPDARS
jgi:branched-chain amino acid transport system ATP-binding protein